MSGLCGSCGRPTVAGGLVPTAENRTPGGISGPIPSQVRFSAGGIQKSHLSTYPNPSTAAGPAAARREICCAALMPPRPAPIPNAALDLALAQAGLLTKRQCTDAGLSREQVRRLLRSHELTAMVRGVVLLGAAVPPSGTRSAALDLSRRRAELLGLLAYGSRAISTGLCALVLIGVRGAPAALSPEVALESGDPRRRIPGIRIRQTVVADRIHLDGFTLASPEVALAQAIPEVDRKTAIALMDSALHLRLVSTDGLERAHDLARGHRRVARTHGWWAQADGRAESPAETAARITCADAGYPPDALQLVIHDHRGQFLARVQLGWQLPDGRWLLAEVDGVDIHGTPAAVIADLHRQNPLITSATVLRRYTGADAFTGRVVREVAPVLRAAGWRPGRHIPPGPLRLPAAA